jgi:arsenite methyltransferase
MTPVDGPDLLFQTEIRELVREAYRTLPAGAGAPIVDRLYRPEDAAAIPQDAIEWALGVGDPIAACDLQPGETVLDVGCGGGIDTVLAGHRVGPGGEVIGLDLLPEMCARTAAAVEEAGTAAWTRVEVGAMEAMPFPDDVVDVVVSNGVLNLSGRRGRALAEMARVLRPGGRFVAADLTIERDLPPEVLGSAAAWAGCLAGAVSPDLLARKLSRAGFVDVAFGPPTPFGLDEAALYPLFPPDVVEALRSVLDDDHPVAQAQLVTARLPSRPEEVSPPGADGHTNVMVASGVQRIEDVPANAVEAPGVTVRHLAGVEDADLKVLDVAPGGSTPHHVHLHAHEGVIVAGHGYLRLDDGPQPLEPGIVFRVNPNEPHAIVNDGDEPLRLVCMDCLVD